MVVWTGKGIYSVLVLILAFVICINILPEDFEDYGFVISSFVAAIFSWVYGTKWNDREEERVFVDQETEEEISFKGTHSLFWIKLQYWGIIYSVIGLYILSQNSTKLTIVFGILLISIFAFVVQKRKKSIKNDFKDTFSHFKNDNKFDTEKKKTEKNEFLRIKKESRIKREISKDKKVIEKTNTKLFDNKTDYKKMFEDAKKEFEEKDVKIRSDHNRFMPNKK